MVDVYTMGFCRSTNITGEEHHLSLGSAAQFMTESSDGIFRVDMFRITKDLWGFSRIYTY